MLTPAQALFVWRGDDLYCLDGYPTSRGTLWQVILVHYLEGLHERAAVNLDEFFAQLMSDINHG